MTADGDDDIPYDPRKYPMRLLGAQLVVATVLGFGALLAFVYYVSNGHSYLMLGEPDDVSISHDKMVSLEIQHIRESVS